MNSEAAGTEWIRKADALIAKWRERADFAETPPTDNSLIARAKAFRICADELAEVIARNVQPSPELGLCENFDAGSRHAVPHVAGACFNWKPIEARPVPQPATEPRKVFEEWAATRDRAWMNCDWSRIGGPMDDAFAAGFRLALRDVPQGQADEQLVIDLARELYDRFLMGGWTPEDAYPQIRAMLAARQVPVSSEKAGS